MEFLKTLPGIILSVGAILAVIVLYVAGLFKKGKSDQSNSLISILQDTVTALQEQSNEQSKKIQKQSEDIEKLTVEVHELKKDNQKYIEIFQGKDQETKDFYKRAYAAIDLVSQSHDILTTVAESIKNTNEAMQKLIDIVGKVAVK